MEFRNLIKSTGLFDAGNKAPTFNFKLSEFGFVSKNDPNKEIQDSWNNFKHYYGNQIGANQVESIDKLQEHLIRHCAKKIQDIAFREFMKLHAREYPEEANDIQLIKLRCSEKFETKADQSNDRKLWEIGNAHDIEHAIEQIGVSRDSGKEVRAIFARPSIALNFAVTAVLKNIFRRIHDTDRELMRKAVETYDGTGLTTPFSLRFWYMRDVHGIEPSSDDFKRQMLRHPDYFKSELLQIKLQALLSSDVNPALMTLLVSQEYQKSKVWFDNNHFDELTQELEQPDFTREDESKGSRTQAKP